ncbi:MAG: hypothetical protein MHM6MM_004486 [Cercozoa sp. M6MM]
MSVSPSRCPFLALCPPGTDAPSIVWTGFIAVVGVVLCLQFLIKFWRRFVSKRETRKAKSLEDTQREHELFCALLRSVDCESLVESVSFSGFNIKKTAVSVQFQDLGLTLKANKQVVLKNVSGEFPAGKLIALMGPSGSGKTSFLFTLCGKAHYGQQTGEILLNGTPVRIRDIRGDIGFVPQDDIVHEELTVRQNIAFSAALRLPVGTASKQRRLIVDDILTMLGLSEIQNTRVGGVTRRGISGGQKKRVNIGLELAAHPMLLFCDEPTSGLDSTASMEVVRGLKKLSQLGTCVVTVIHQPRWEIFTMFDLVLLFGAGGGMAYLGAASRAPEYFEDLGFQEATPGSNVADCVHRQAGQ